MTCKPQKHDMQVNNHALVKQQMLKVSPKHAGITHLDCLPKETPFTTSENGFLVVLARSTMLVELSDEAFSPSFLADFSSFFWQYSPFSPKDKILPFDSLNLAEILFKNVWNDL